MSAAQGSSPLSRAVREVDRVTSKPVTAVVVTVLVLRAHYTMDVYAGAMTALFIGLLAEKLAAPCDRWLARFTGGPK